MSDPDDDDEIGDMRDLLERVAANVGAGHEDPELPPPNTCLTLRSLHRLLVTTHGARIAPEVRP